MKAFNPLRFVDGEVVLGFPVAYFDLYFASFSIGAEGEARHGEEEGAGIGRSKRELYIEDAPDSQ